MPAVNKHLEKGERLIQKGKLESALNELFLARNEDPSNDSIVLTIADLYQRLNKPRECRHYYGFLFDKYAEAQDVQKTVEFFRKLQNFGMIEPKRLLSCARLVEKLRPEEAAEHYTHALEASEGQDPETCLECLQGLARLQPSSFDIRRRMAELASKLGRNEVAVPAFRRMGELLAAEKKYREAVEALENAYRLSGEDAQVKLALAKACSRAKRFPRVLELMEKEAEQSDEPVVLALVADAFFAEKQFPKAEAVYWKLARTTPDAVYQIIEIAMAYLHEGNLALGLPLLKKLEEALSAAKQQRGLVLLAEKVCQVEHADLSVLEFLAQLADALHLDTPLAKALDSLFDLYFAAGEFHKATDALERLIDVDPYAPECFTKLQRLEGKCDQAIWREFATRLGKTATVKDVSFASSAGPAAEAPEPEEAVEGPGTLGDLMLQAEIFLQYKLHDKARERLERIAKLFPGEEEKNEELRELFERTNISVPAPARPAGGGGGEAGEPDWSRVSEIIRSLSRQRTVKGVLSAAVNGIGRLWQASRCVAGLAAPKHPPSIALEYISPGVKPSDVAVLAKLVMGLQLITEERASPLVTARVAEERQLGPLKSSLTALQVKSLAAIPLRADEQACGILVIEECESERNWAANDLVALETLADQIVVAVSNARLRTLMRTLSITDERTGLLQRDSYLTCLLSEAERMRTQKMPLAVAILDFCVTRPSPSGERAEQDEEALEEFMKYFRTTFTSHLRQNDLPVKYGAHSLAVILPGTTAKGAFLVVEKMRKLMTSFSPSDAERVLSVTAGVAEAVRGAEMDGADRVTELINRAEWALEEARTLGNNATKVLDPPRLPQMRES